MLVRLLRPGGRERGSLFWFAWARPSYDWTLKIGPVPEPPGREKSNGGLSLAWLTGCRHGAEGGFAWDGAGQGKFGVYWRRWQAEDGKCLLSMSIWRGSEPLAICQAALLSIYKCKLPT